MNIRSMLRWASVALLTGATCLVTPPAHAGFDIDFGASVRVGDDADLYFAISSRYFDRDRRVVERYAARYNNPDDLAVSFYLSRCSGRPANFIFDMRRRGLSWWDVSLRLGLPVDVWFVEVERDPGPPYGRAYGHWKHHRRNARPDFALSDDDARNLVAVRMIHEYYDVPVDVAMEWRSSGRNLRAIMADEYGNRRGKSHGHDQDRNRHRDEHPGKGHGRKNKH